MPRLSLAALALMAGCAAPKHWYKAGATEQDFHMDQGQCQAQAYGTNGMPPMQVAIVYNSCMRGKGWYLQ